MWGSSAVRSAATRERMRCPGGPRALTARVVVATMSAGTALTGCTGVGDVAGQPQAVGDPAFSPCDDIPDDVIAGLGLDVETEEREIAGTDQRGWNVCSWIGLYGAPALSISATTTVADVTSRQGHADIRTVTVEGREATRFRNGGDAETRNCGITLESGEGAVILTVDYLGVDAVLTDPCDVAVERTRALIGFIPE